MLWAIQIGRLSKEVLNGKTSVKVLRDCSYLLGSGVFPHSQSTFGSGSSSKGQQMNSRRGQVTCFPPHVKKSQTRQKLWSQQGIWIPGTCGERVDRQISPQYLTPRQFGEVWRCKLKKTSRMIAVKKVNTTTAQDVQALLKEIAIMKKCVSPYIVKHYGNYYKDDVMWVSSTLCSDETHAYR